MSKVSTFQDRSTIMSPGSDELARGLDAWFSGGQPHLFEDDARLGAALLDGGAHVGEVHDGDARLAGMSRCRSTSGSVQRPTDPQPSMRGLPLENGPIRPGVIRNALSRCSCYAQSR